MRRLIPRNWTIFPASRKLSAMEKSALSMTLDLNSPAWATLDDACGSAENIPALLQGLRQGSSEALDDLYGRICHQGSLYPASIAAFPHLVSISENAPSKRMRIDALLLAGAIHASEDVEDQLGSSPYSEAFHAAVPDALHLSIASLGTVDDTNTGVYLLMAAASFAGFAVVARQLVGFADAEFYLGCPGCGNDLYVWPDQEGLAVAAEDPVTSPRTKKLTVKAGPVKNSPHNGAFAWLSTQLALAPNLNEIALRLPSLFGTASCPSCGTSLSLIDALVDDAA